MLAPVAVTVYEAVPGVEHAAWADGCTLMETPELMVSARRLEVTDPQVPPTTQPHEISVTGLPPILVVPTTNDPATPYQAGVDLARQLGGTLVTFGGTQHTVVFQGSTCVDDIAARYLIDLVVPPPGTRC